jgi:hypothetical protein
VLAPSVEENKSNSKFYTIPVNGGQAVETPIIKNTLQNISPDGQYIYNEEIKINKVHGKDFYLILKNQMFKFMMVWIIAIGIPE